jgi:hypothetical protein
MRLCEEARQAIATHSPAQSPSIQRRSRRRLDVATHATPAPQVVDIPQPMSLQSCSRSRNPAGSHTHVTLHPTAMGTTNLVSVLGDVPPILSQEECFWHPSRGRGNRRGGNPHGPSRGRRQNLVQSLQGHRGGRHGVHRDD